MSAFDPTDIKSAEPVCSLGEHNATGGNLVGEPKISSSRPGTRQQNILSGPTRWCEDRDGSTKPAVASEVGDHHDPLVVRTGGDHLVLWGKPARAGTAVTCRDRWSGYRPRCERFHD